MVLKIINIIKYIIKYLILILFVFLFHGIVHGQAYESSDSLIDHEANDSIKITNLIRLSKEHLTKSDSLALAFSTEALSVAKSLRNDQLMLMSYSQLLSTYYYKKDFKSAKITIGEAENTVFRVGSMEEKAKHFLICGKVCNRLSEYNLAQYYLTKSMMGYEQIQKLDSLQTIYLELANNYKIRHEYDAAAKNANLALKFAISKNNLRGIALSKRKLGEIFAEQKNPDIALEYFF